MVDTTDLKSVDRRSYRFESGRRHLLTFENQVIPKIDTKFPLTSLALWFDDSHRSGPENMAIDEWLLETADRPVLRVYSWEAGWGSLGHFGKLDEARESVSDVRWVRRGTGGGIVDHRADWTYTLVIPNSEAMARLKGAESYQLIHKILADVLSDRIKLSLAGESSVPAGGCCFVNPVLHDLISGKSKIAGAGQRRTKFGLLHQGSVAITCDQIVSIDRSKQFARALAAEWEWVMPEPPPGQIDEKIATTYGNDRWTNRW